jgi:putative hydrolase of the HAD superfamily
MTMPIKPQSQHGGYTELSLWLLPAEPIKKRLHAIIQGLAEKYDAVSFEPHVTIFSGSSDDDKTASIARGIVKSFSPFELTVLRLDHTRNFTKTLFIQFQESEIARSMFNAIKERSERPTNYVLNPHLSLLYKAIPVAAQAELCQTLDVPNGLYSFDRLRVIETEIPLNRPDQIKRWRTVFESALHQP